MQHRTTITDKWRKRSVQSIKLTIQSSQSIQSSAYFTALIPIWFIRVDADGVDNDVLVNAQWFFQKCTVLRTYTFYVNRIVAYTFDTTTTQPHPTKS